MLLLNDKASSISLASLAVSFARVQGGEEAVTEERFSHHALPAANKLCYPHEILIGRETELHLNVVKKLKSCDH